MKSNGFREKTVLNYNVFTFLKGDMIDHEEFFAYEFGPYRLDLRKRQLTRDNTPIQLTAKAFDTLAVLLTEPGVTLSKSKLMDSVWPEISVEENNLTQQISALRKAFGERASDHKYIVTVSGKGYCFVAPVKKLSTESRNTPPNSFIKTFLSLFPSESVIGYGLAALYILSVCVPAIFVQMRSEARGLKPQSIAILQFRSNGLGDELLGMGIRDTLRAKLGSVDDITVRPAEEVVSTGVVDAGKQVHADVVLTGSIQRDNDRVRVAVEIVDVTKERVVWGNTFDNDRSNTFELQDSIADAVLSALKRPKLNSWNHWTGHKFTDLLTADLQQRSTIPVAAKPAHLNLS